MDEEMGRLFEMWVLLDCWVLNDVKQMRIKAKPEYLRDIRKATRIFA